MDMMYRYLHREVNMDMMYRLLLVPSYSSRVEPIGKLGDMT